METEQKMFVPPAWTERSHCQSFLIVAVQLKPRKVLLHKQRIPIAFYHHWNRMYVHTVPFSDFQPDIILGLYNLTVLVGGQLPYRLNNGTKFIRHIIVELTIQECTSVTLIPARGFYYYASYKSRPYKVQPYPN